MQQVKSLMTSQVEVISPNSSVKEAATKMKRLDIGVLPVVEGEQILGMITDRDIVVRGIADGQDLQQLKARDIMSKDVVFCHEDEDAQRAVELMRDRKVGRLMVVDSAQKLRGILSLGNISRDLGEERLAGLVNERLIQEEGEVDFRDKRNNFGLIFAATAGIGILIAGVLYLRQRPELIEQLGEGFREREKGEQAA